MFVFNAVTHLDQIKIAFTFIANGAPVWAEQKFLQKKTHKVVLLQSVVESESHSNPMHIYLSMYGWDTGGNQAQEDNPLHLCQSDMSSVLPFYLHKHLAL